MTSSNCQHCYHLGYDLVNLPGSLAFLIIASISCLIGVVGLLIRKKIFPGFHFTDDVISFATTFLSIIGGLTAFTISFVIVNAWIRYQEQVIRVEHEAVELSNFYRDCYAFPRSYGKLLQDGILRYNDLLINDGWPKLMQGEESVQCRKEINWLYNMLLSRFPSNEIEKITLRNNLEHIHQLVLYRHLRVLDSQHPIIPDILWYAIFAGFFLTMLITFFIQLKKLRSQILLVVIFAISMSTLIFVGLTLNYPYRGVIRLMPFPLEKFREEGREFYPVLFTG